MIYCYILIKKLKASKDVLGKQRLNFKNHLFISINSLNFSEFNISPHNFPFKVIWGSRHSD